MTCKIELIPLHCPNCNFTIGHYTQVGNAVYVLLGFELVQSITGTCLCGYRFVEFGMPKSWDKLKRRYEERVNDKLD